MNFVVCGLVLINPLFKKKCRRPVYGITSSAQNANFLIRLLIQTPATGVDVGKRRTGARWFALEVELEGVFRNTELADTSCFKRVRRKPTWLSRNTWIRGNPRLGCHSTTYHMHKVSLVLKVFYSETSKTGLGKGQADLEAAWVSC